MGLICLKPNNIKIQWLAVLFVLIPGTAIPASPTPNHDFEEERWFQIELIIFSHNNKEALESEDWPKITGIVLPEGLVELAPPAPRPPLEKTANVATRESLQVFEPVNPPTEGDPELEPGEPVSEPVPMPVAFEMLPEEELQLSDTLKKLSRSPQFDTLLHVAWRQPTFDKEHSQTVLLYEGMTEPVPENTEENVSTTARTRALSDNKLHVNDHTDEGPLNPQVIGTVQLSVARYLHLAADLIYRVPVSERLAIPLPDLELWYDRPYPTLSQHQGPAYQLEKWNVIHGFRLEESRRMRSKKVHYLDHPFFGVVVLVTPVELPKKPEENSILDPTRNISTPQNKKAPSININ